MDASPALLDAAPAASDADVTRLRARIDELSQERARLLTTIDVLQDITSSLHFSEILQHITRRLGDLFGLDRCSVYLAGEGASDVHLVATFEDPSLRNLLVDLGRYPELARAFASGETVFIPDAAEDPALAGVRLALHGRGVRSIVVVPMRWRTSVIGALALRTERGATPFTAADIEFCEVIASLAAKALRNAHRYESLERAGGRHAGEAERQRRTELERIALIGFLRRLLDRYTTGDEHAWAETLLPRASDEELDRLTAVALQVIAEEARG